MKRIINRTILTVHLLLLTFVGLFSQYSDLIYTVENFFVNEGLPVIRVYDICQDKKGLIWVCTESGLYTFNGIDFARQIDFGKQQFYPKEIIFDNNDNIWLLDYRFPNSAIPKSKLTGLRIFTPSLEPIDSNEYATQEVHDANRIIQNEYGVLYFQAKNKVYSFDKTLNEIKFPISTDSYLFNDNEYIVLNDSTDIIILENNSLKEVVRIKNQIGSSVKKYQNKIIIQYLSGDIIIYNTTIKALEDNGSVLPAAETSYFLKSIDRFGVSWSISLNSLRRFDHNTKLIDDLNEQAYFKPGSYLTSIFIDQEDNIWVGSNEGLYKISTNKQDQFRGSLDLNVSTRALCELNKDEIFVANYEGDLIYNRRTKKIKKLEVSNGQLDHIKNIKFGVVKKGDFYYTVNSLNLIRKVRLADNKTVLEKTIVLGEDYPINPPVLLNSIDDKFILKLGHRVFKFDEDLNLTLVYEDSSASFRNIQAIKDKIYLSTTKGIKVFNQEFKEIESHLEKYIIRFIHQDKVYQNVLWVNTSSYLIKYNKETGVEKVFDSSSGFINTNFTAIYEDDQGYLWLPSFAGLNRFNKENLEIKAFLTEDGISNNEFNNYSCTITEDGSFVFGGISGLTIVDPSLGYKESIPAPNIDIYNCTKFNSEEEINITKSANTEKKIEIKESDVLTKLIFAHYSYNKLKSKIFRYRILTSDKKETIVPWVNLKSNELQLGKMPYGKYDLELQAITRSGDKLSEINKFQLDYITPIMQTNLFRALSLLFLACFVYFLIHIRSQSLIQQKLALEHEVNQRTIQIKKQNEELEKINNTKDKLFSILAHDLKSPLITLKNISGKINYLIQKNQPDRILEIGKTLEDKVSNLSVFLDNLLNWSLQQRGHITYNPEQIQLYVLVKDILKLYEDQILEKGIIVKDAIPNNSSCYADKNSIHAVLRNLINNSIKYSPVNQKLILQFEEGASHNVISISDKGKGIDQKIINSLYNNENIQSEKGTSGELGTGLGLLISKELVELNKGHLKFHSSPGQGTKVDVHLPKTKSSVS